MKGTEYDRAGRTVFKGKYKQGIRFEGEAQEFYYPGGAIAFRCTYKDGIGTGKEYYPDGKIKFEGKYITSDQTFHSIEDLQEAKKFLSGIVGFSGEGEGETAQRMFESGEINRSRNGYGKYYDEDGNLRFEGNYANGLRDGKGYVYGKPGEQIYLNSYKKGKLEHKIDIYQSHSQIDYNKECGIAANNEIIIDGKNEPNNIINIETSSNIQKHDKKKNIDDYSNKNKEVNNNDINMIYGDIFNQSNFI